MKICVTGDSILMAPFPESYKGFEAVKAHIGQADVRINNLEMVISQGDKFASTYCGGIWLTGKPERLDDVCSYGFNCFGFANNHTMDFSYGGMENTLRELEKRKKPVCGAGMSLEAATAPAMVEAAGEKVAVLCISATCDDAARAGDAQGNMPARPGLNMLRHSETFLVNEAHMKALEEIAAATHINGRINNSKAGGYTQTKPGIFSLGSVDFKLSDVEGKSSAPHPGDMERMKKAIEEASKEASYVVVCFHSHEIKGDDDEEPDFFIEEFARSCIDWGASAVVGSGTHQIKAIELYKGKPIFYSIANFIFQVDKMTMVPRDYYEKFRVDPSKTIDEAEYIRSNGGTRGLETQFKNYKGLMPLLEFESGKLKSVKIRPVELNFRSEKACKGLPQLADAEVTEDIFGTLCRLSAPYGTRLTLSEGVIGVNIP
ncbi:MAG: CapA family protein [Oscillospiraceae bacterium]|nr:CapA family protein [Oscillospiraceae bacterium]